MIQSTVTNADETGVASHPSRMTRPSQAQGESTQPAHAITRGKTTEGRKGESFIQPLIRSLLGGKVLMLDGVLKNLQHKHMHSDPWKPTLIRQLYHNVRFACPKSTKGHSLYFLMLVESRTAARNSQYRRVVSEYAKIGRKGHFQWK